MKINDLVTIKDENGGRVARVVKLTTVTTESLKPDMSGIDTHVETKATVLTFPDMKVMSVTPDMLVEMPTTPEKTTNRRTKTETSA